MYLLETPGAENWGRVNVYGLSGWLIRCKAVRQIETPQSTLLSW